MQQAAEGAGTEWRGLLSAIAEQLKVPLTVISRQAELDQLVGSPGESAGSRVIRTQADAALQLVDSYLLGLELMRSQTQLELEPVSVSSLLVDIAHDLTRFARQYDVDIQVVVQGKYGPVMAHSRGLRAALLSLGISLAEVQATQESKQVRRLVLAMYRTADGISTGMYGLCGLQPAQWRTALRLVGQAQQPFTGLSAGTSAGLFVADTIFRSMASRLRLGVWQHQHGLVATLQPSRQLQFV